MGSLIDKGKVADKISDLFLDNYPNPSKELETFYKEVLKIVVNEKGQSNWISVKDRLPENDSLYIVCRTIYPYQIVFEAKWEDGKWVSVVTSNQLEYITHWQSLPKPPKEDDVE